MGGIVKSIGRAIKKVLKPVTKVVSKVIKFAGDITKKIYKEVFDDILGIDSKRFLGIKGGIFGKIGQFLQDTFHDHVHKNLALGVVVAGVALGFYNPGAYGLASKAVYATYTAGFTSSLAIYGSYYGVLAASYVGVSLLASGLVNGAVLSMYPEINQNINDYEEQKESARVGNLGDVLSGEVFDKMAGGKLYASQFAGDIYYEATTPGNLNISVGEPINISPLSVALNFGYIDSTLKNLAGDDGFSVVDMTIQN